MVSVLASSVVEAKFFIEFCFIIQFYNFYNFFEHTVDIFKVRSILIRMDIELGKKKQPIGFHMGNT
jgi:hypothetical protein